MAFPAPVTTAARTPGSRARSAKAAVSPAISSGTIKLSGGRSRTIHAHPSRAATLTKGPVSVTALVAPHRRVDGLRPVIEASSQVDRLGVAELAQIVRDGGAADAMMAVDDDLVLPVQLVHAELDLVNWDVCRILHAAELGLPAVADVEEDQRLPAVEPLLELSGADVVGHGRSPCLLARGRGRARAPCALTIAS